MVTSKSESKSILFKYARYSEVLIFSKSISVFLLLIETYLKIINFIDTTVASNIDLASSYVAGQTIENRQLKVIKLKAPNVSSSKAVWIGKFGLYSC